MDFVAFLLLVPRPHQKVSIAFKIEILDAIRWLRFRSVLIWIRNASNHMIWIKCGSISSIWKQISQYLSEQSKAISQVFIDLLENIVTGHPDINLIKMFISSTNCNWNYFPCTSTISSTPMLHNYQFHGFWTLLVFGAVSVYSSYRKTKSVKCLLY